MADANALTRADLVTAILGRRFPSSTQTTNARRWLNSAYLQVWSAHPWTFETVSLANLAVTVNNRTPTVPTDFADVLDLYDDAGWPLVRMNERDYERAYASGIVAAAAGQPAAFTVIDRQILLGPIPQASATYKLSYRRRLSHRDTALAVVAGAMSVDTDYPLWSDHHAVLIPRAAAIGLAEINDPTWQLQQQEYERQLQLMVLDYGVALTGQYGDAWDA